MEMDLFQWLFNCKLEEVNSEDDADEDIDEHDGDNDNDNSIMIKTINTIDRPHGTRSLAINIDLSSIFLPIAISH